MVHSFAAPISMENGVEGLFKPDSGTQYSIDIALGRKRRITEGEDSDDENSETAPPLHDIYRSRQQKRIKWSILYQSCFFFNVF